MWGHHGSDSQNQLLTQYLKVGSLGKFHTKYVNALWCEEKLYCWSKVSWGRRGSNSENLVYKIMSIQEALDTSHGVALNLSEYPHEFCHMSKVN